MTVQLPAVLTGVLKLAPSPNRFVYIKIEDKVVNNLFEEFKKKGAPSEAELPPYFDSSRFAQPIGAHVTLINSYQFRQIERKAEFIEIYIQNTPPFEMRCVALEERKPQFWREMEVVWICTVQSRFIDLFFDAINFESLYQPHFTYAVKPVNFQTKTFSTEKEVKEEEKFFEADSMNRARFLELEVQKLERCLHQYALDRPGLFSSSFMEHLNVTVTEDDPLENEEELDLFEDIKGAHRPTSSKSFSGLNPVEPKKLEASNPWSRPLTLNTQSPLKQIASPSIVEDKSSEISQVIEHHTSEVRALKKIKTFDPIHLKPLHLKLALDKGFNIIALYIRQNAEFQKIPAAASNGKIEALIYSHSSDVTLLNKMALLPKTDLTLTHAKIADKMGFHRVSKYIWEIIAERFADPVFKCIAESLSLKEAVEELNKIRPFSINRDHIVYAEQKGFYALADFFKSKLS